MVYRNPYHGYSSEEYGAYGQGETYRGDQTAYQAQEHTQVTPTLHTKQDKPTNVYELYSQYIQ